jgi:hydrogenase maturation factor HypF (carbamoyltransferase family)
MYDREKKNINKLLENIQVSGLHSWYVSDLRDMEWKGHIRLTLNVVIKSEQFKHKFIREWNTSFDTSNFEFSVKQKLIGLLKHYAHSFLGLHIGDVKVVNLISFEMVNPTNYYTSYSDYNNLYTSHDEYDWFT